MAKKKATKKVTNTINTKSKVNTIEPKIAVQRGLVIDFSFDSAFCSSKKNDFTNYLRCENDFIHKFRELMSLINKISNKEFQKDLIMDSGMRHCHKLNIEKTQYAMNLIEKALANNHLDLDRNKISNILEQEIGGEDLYQIGFEEAIRIIGIYNDVRDIFKVYLIDYHHRLSFQKERNELNLKNLNFCPMSTVLK